MAPVAIETSEDVEDVSETLDAGITTVLTGTRVVLICSDLAESGQFDWPFGQPTTVTTIVECTVEVIDSSELAGAALTLDIAGFPVAMGWLPSVTVCNTVVAATSVSVVT